MVGRSTSPFSARTNKHSQRSNDIERSLLGGESCGPQSSIKTRSASISSARAYCFAFSRIQVQLLVDLLPAICTRRPLGQSVCPLPNDFRRPVVTQFRHDGRRHHYLAKQLWQDVRNVAQATSNSVDLCRKQRAVTRIFSNPIQSLLVFLQIFSGIVIDHSVSGQELLRSRARSAPRVAALRREKAFAIDNPPGQPPPAHIAKLPPGAVSNSLIITSGSSIVTAAMRKFPFS